MKTLKIILLMAIAMAMWTLSSVSAATTSNSTDNTSVNPICVVASVDQGMDATLSNATTDAEKNKPLLGRQAEVVNDGTQMVKQIESSQMLVNSRNSATRTTAEFSEVEKQDETNVMKRITYVKDEEVIKIPTFAAMMMMMTGQNQSGLDHTGYAFIFDADTTNAELSMNLFGSEVTKMPNWVENCGQVLQSMMAGINILS